MELDDRRHLDVSPTLKAKLLELLELKKLPLEELAQAFYIHDTSPYATVADLVNQYESRNQALTLEKWKFIFKKLHLSKELKELLAVDQSVMMIDPTAVGEVNCSGSLPAEKSLQGTQPSQDLVEPRGVPLQDKPFVSVNDPSLKLPVVNPRARERAIPKTKQPRPPPSTVKPVVEEIMLIGGPGSQSDLNLLSMPGGNFGGASTVIPEPGKAKHGIQLPSSLSEDSQMQPGCLRTPAILTVTHDVSQDSESNLNLPSIQAGDCTVDSRTSSTGTRPVTPEGASNPVGRLAGHQLHLNQEASQENNLVGETCPSVTDDATENNDHFQQHCRQQCAQLQATIDKMCELKDQEIQQLRQLCEQKDQDVETLSAENCQLKVMVKELKSRLAELAEVSCSAPSPDTVQENLVSSSNALQQILDEVNCSEPPIAEGSLSGTQPNDTSRGSRLVDNPRGRAIPKTKQPWPPLHTVKPDIGKKMEAQPPLLLPVRHNNRSDQTDPFEGDCVPKNGKENDRAVGHYDAIENNGPQESRQQCANLKVFSDHLQAENQKLRRSLKEQKQLKNWLLEECYQLLLLLARQANDVPTKGSSAAVEENNVSDGSEGVEPEAPMQYHSFGLVQETDSEETSDDESERHVENEISL